MAWKKNVLAILMILTVYMALVVVIDLLFKKYAVSNQFGVDWLIFKDAVRVLENPYVVDGFFSPVWALVPVVPFQFLPEPLGYIAFAVFNLFCFVFVAMKMRMRFLLFLPWLIFGGVLRNSLFGNIDGVVSLGLVLPPQIGLLFLMAKPQIGLPIAVFWAYISYRNGGFALVARTFFPVAAAFLLSFAVYGLWILKAGALTDISWNTALWPWAIPLGVFSLAWALWKRELRWALVSTAFLTPYLAVQSWAFMWLGVLSTKDESQRWSK
jgi:hypothetical protein